jgi:hypothetical protein
MFLEEIFAFALFDMVSSCSYYSRKQCMEAPSQMTSYPIICKPMRNAVKFYRDSAKYVGEPNGS